MNLKECIDDLADVRLGDLASRVANTDANTAWLAGILPVALPCLAVARLNSWLGGLLAAVFNVFLAVCMLAFILTPVWVLSYITFGIYKYLVI